MRDPPTIKLHSDLTLHSGQQMALGAIDYARLHTSWRLVTGDEPATATLSQFLDPTPGVLIRIGKTRKTTSVLSDPERTVRLAIEHLQSRGFTHFAGVGLSSAAQEAISAPALPLSPDGRVAKQALQSLESATAILCCSELPAYWLATDCKTAGIAVPDRVAILSLRDGPLLCELAATPISSVDHAAYQIGYEAARLLDRMLNGRSVPEKTLLPPLGITARASTDVLAIDDRDIAQAVRFIRANAHRPLAVADVLRNVAIHRRSLERGFRKVLGRSPTEELRDARVAIAQRLLARTDAPLAEIARNSGFILPQHLTAAFKQVTGLTPSAYREQFKRK